MTSPFLPPGAAELDSALERVTVVALAEDEYVTTRYRLRADEEARSHLVRGLANVVMFLYEGVAVASEPEPETWAADGVVSRVAWEGLTAEIEGYRTPLLGWVGEAFAWWHELMSPEVVFASQPDPGSSRPAFDCVSALDCDAGILVRAVQAKATHNRPRPLCLEALENFQSFQAGRYDPAWNPALRVLRMEMKLALDIDLPVAALAGGGRVTHFGIGVAFGIDPANHPASDYANYTTAHAPHGRAIAMYHHADVAALIDDIAGVISTARANA